MFQLSALAAAFVSLSAVVAQSDPSVWTADSRLHRSLWGIAYTCVYFRIGLEDMC